MLDAEAPEIRDLVDLQRAARRAAHVGLVTRDAIKGCTDVEVDELKSAQSVSELPFSYREFLLFSGKTPYWLSLGGEWDYEWVLEAKVVAREIVEEDYEGDFSPFAESFIFETHQGYMFNFFRKEDLPSNDPYFWIYTGGRPLRRSSATFSEWIRRNFAELPRRAELGDRLHRR
ncbi:SMI1/KNR4 family protein [Nocardia carnea]|uniref:SMI1/KNR4 family protein n=1 Tax=Nocardia carnea TaxID=37328 RepID=A0ABW7TKG8_9NOCA|nr:SMI1/KNR4 family protein [Nocardia carnea]